MPSPSPSRNGKAKPPVLDRLPPHNDEAERAVLGSIILSPSEATPICISHLTGGAQAFYDLRHQTIYDVMVKMYDAQEEIDLVTLDNWLLLLGQLDAIGGTVYLASLVDCTPSPANVKSYIDIVQDNYRKRQAIQICSSVVSGLYDGSEPVQDAAEHASQSLSDIAGIHSSTEESSMTELVHGTIQILDNASSHQGAISGLETGFIDLDKITMGLHEGEMIVLAGRPGMGKTTLALNIAEHVSVESHLPVGVFSLEMTKEALAMKLLCSLARVNMRRAQQGFLSDHDFPRITTAAGRLQSAPLFINDACGLSIVGLRARARRMSQQHGIKLLVVDYLQLISSERSRHDSRQQEVGMVSSGLKALAKELKVPVIAISQLNRNIENDKVRRPRLADLRESGNIEQDADVVGFLYRPKDREEDDASDSADACAVNLDIAKQRNGPTGMIELTFLKGLSRFESAAKVEVDYQPPYPDSEPMQAELPVET